MSDQTTSSIERRVASTTVQATVEQCFAVGIDVQSYPNWIESLTEVEIESRNAEGKPDRVRFEASGLGRRASYVLAYDLGDAPAVLGWTLVTGDLARAIEGAYRFSDATEEGGQPATFVEYELSIDLAVPLPGYVKRRAEDKIMEAALRRFKQEVERVASS
ncbi:MAG: SRPBCC family protein [Acidimicrobiia bacterium]|nr:SRPBCC family protein [Acidimicrobiia bacterium]